MNMVERPILFSAPMVRAILDGRKTRKLYAPAGTDSADPAHLAKRLANGINSAPDGQCWEWTRVCNQYGYGQLRISGRMVYAHRLAYELGVCPIPDGMHVLHQCDNPRCINPAHLSIGTRSQNMKECSQRGRSRIPNPAKLGEQNGSAKLRDVDVRSIRRLLSGGWTQLAIAERFGVSQQTIANIKRGKVWGHVK